MLGRTFFPGFALVVVLCVLWAGAARAQNAPGASKDPATLQQAADKGDARAQATLGGMYLQGQGVPQDLAKAATLLQKAADQGDVWAQNLLGQMCIGGDNVPQDDAKGVALLQKAMDQGGVYGLLAQSLLGNFYVQGLAGLKDAEKGCRLLRDVTAKGLSGEQKTLNRYCAK